MADPTGDLLNQIAEEDRDLYATLLFLPEDLRPDAGCLYGFHLEISRIPFLISDPMPGEIRLQWWRDVLSGERQEEAVANPLAIRLLTQIKRHNLPVDGFIRYLDAREFDLYNDPMPDRETLEAYLGETESFILQMITLCAGIQGNRLVADCCGHSGVAVGISNLVSRIAFDKNHQRVYVPGDLLAATGLNAQKWFSGDDHELMAAFKGFVSLGNEHLTKATNAVNQLDKADRSVFLPLVLAKARLAKATSLNELPKQGIALSPLSTQFHLWKTAIRGF